jgi:hypothetical protein
MIRELQQNLRPDFWTACSVSDRLRSCSNLNGDGSEMVSLGFFKKISSDYTDQRGDSTDHLWNTYLCFTSIVLVGPSSVDL